MRLTCNRFNEFIKNLGQESTKTQSVREVADLLNHCVGCEECNKVYGNWYYSSDNFNFEKYMKEDRQFRKAVEARKNGNERTKLSK